jgi:membrane fusion protein, heavy metal efflux system
MTFTEHFLKPARVALLAAGLAFGVAVLAGPGHDHGDEAPAAAGTASPRISLHSDLFELVGIVSHDTMTIYLDRYASNEPVRGAKLEVEAGEVKAVAVEQADGSYLFKHAVLDKEGSLSVSFTVTAGTDADLLAGDLEIGHHHDAPAATAATPSRWRIAAYAAAALALLAAITFTVQRLRRRSAAL